MKMLGNLTFKGQLAYNLFGEIFFIKGLRFNNICHANTMNELQGKETKVENNWGKLNSHTKNILQY